MVGDSGIYRLPYFSGKGDSGDSYDTKHCQLRAYHSRKLLASIEKKALQEAGKRIPKHVEDILREQSSNDDNNDDEDDDEWEDEEID